MLNNVIKFLIYSAGAVIIAAVFSWFVTAAASTCDDQFRASIEHECKYIKCVSWEEVEVAIKKARAEELKQQEIEL